MLMRRSSRETKDTGYKCDQHAPEHVIQLGQRIESQTFRCFLGSGDFVIVAWRSRGSLQPQA